MRKLFLGAAALIFTGLLAGCNHLTQYTLSEQQVNTYLLKHNDFQKKVGVPGVLDAHITLTDLNSQIGRAEPGKITLSGNADIDIKSLFGKKKADMTLTLKATPVYNKEEGAIYLKDLEVVNYTVKPEKMQSVIDGLMPYLNQSLASYFDQKPAYVLNGEHSEKEAMAKRLAKGIVVKPGELVIPFTD
jgi:hypothetical protein